MRKLLFLLLLFPFAFGHSQTNSIQPPTSIPALSSRAPSLDVAQRLAATITSEELERHLSILASDEFEGRETGTEGQRKAAAYIAEIFEAWDLPKKGDDNSYFQKIAFSSENWQEIKMSINGKKIKHLWDYYTYPTTNSTREELVVNEVLFLGYGIDDERYSDYEGVDVSGKVIMIYDGEPSTKGGISHISGSKEMSDWSSNWRRKITVAREKGVNTVLIIDSQFKKNVRQARKYILNTRLKLGGGENPNDNYANNCFITTKLAKDIIGSKYKKLIKARDKISKNGKPRHLTLACDLSLTQKKKERRILGENVLGYIEGSDEKLKDELVIITAHYDHLGSRGDVIYNGADDNGSGTSTVMEVCQAFAEAKKQGLGPRRSVLAMLVSGEEKGLLGSQYYVNKPVFPLENTVVDVNVDMVGRVDKKHEGRPNYIYVIGSDRLSSELHEINETANTAYTNLELDYTYNAEDDPNRYYYRSDHYNFAEKGIPAIFYFNGTHKDYHRPTDTVDKINFEKMETIARLIFYTCWELANRDKRIEVDVEGK